MVEVDRPPPALSVTVASETEATAAARLRWSISITAVSEMEAELSKSKKSAARLEAELSGLRAACAGEVSEAGARCATALELVEDFQSAEAALRARSHCRVAPPRIHFIPDSLTYSAPLFMKRQWDRTLGGAPGGA